MSYGLYKWNGQENQIGYKDLKIDVEIFYPTWKKPIFWLSHYKNNKNFFNYKKQLIYEVLWAITSHFKYKIYYVKENNVIIHYTFVIFYNFKFPFLIADRDCLYGPSFTLESYRGKGIYPRVLEQLCSNEKRSGEIYTIIRDENISSIKGANKAGFFKVALLHKTQKTKIYEIINENNKDSFCM